MWKITATSRKMITGSGSGKPKTLKLLPNQVKLSLSSATGWPCVYHLATPRADTIMPSVAMKGGISVLAMMTPLSSPATNPTASPMQDWPDRRYVGERRIDGACELLAVCAKLAATMAISPTIEPEERSTPPVMITWVTPTAMMPMTDTCRMMIESRCLLARKLWPTKIQPRISKTSAMPISTARIDTSAGNRFLVPMMLAGTAVSVAIAVLFQIPGRRSV